MTFDDIKEMQIGSKKVKEAWLNGRQVYPSEKRIMDSLICWYDIGKQQCTNESMAANPVLADLSGNGHDITCYNFAWAGMSGIGGYVTDFTSFWSVYSNAQYTRNQTIINVTHIAPNNEDFIVGWLSEYTAHSVTSGTEFSLPPVRFKVTGIADLQLIAQVRGDEQAYTQDISEGVEYYFPGGNFTCARNTNVGFAIKYKSGTQPTGQEIDLNLVVEILPEYPNALVSDGVDDYTEAIQVFPKDEGTSIAVIQQLEGNRSTALLMPSDKEGLSNIWYNGLFVGGNNLLGIGFYNGTGRQTIVYYAEGEIYEKNTSVFTWNNTVTKVVVNLNNRQSKEGTVEQFHTQYGFFKDYNSNTYAQAALYSFLLFDRTLTTAEIEWVKKNMIESGGVLATNWADSSLWVFYNLSNQSRIDGTISNNRMVIAANGKRTDIGVTANFMECIVRNSIVPAYKIKVTGLKNGIILNYVDNTIHVEMAEDGIYNIPEHNTQNRYFGFSFNKAFENENIVIQQLLSE